MIYYTNRLKIFKSRIWERTRVTFWHLGHPPIFTFSSTFRYSCYSSYSLFALLVLLFAFDVVFIFLFPVWFLPLLKPMLYITNNYCCIWKGTQICWFVGSSLSVAHFVAIKIGECSFIYTRVSGTITVNFPVVSPHLCGCKQECLWKLKLLLVANHNFSTSVLWLY